MTSTPIYVLNLTRSPQRRSFMEDICARAGVEAEFLSAVDGRACRSTRPPRAALSRAETALILSHRKAWRKLLASEASHAIVLEDDVHLGAGFSELTATDWGTLTFDVIKLETMFHKALVSRERVALRDRALHLMRSEHVGAAGYVVSRAGARKLLNLTRSLGEPVDQTIFGRRAIRGGEILAYQLLPAIVVQDNLHPDRGARVGVATTLHEPDRLELSEASRRAKPRGLVRLRREFARPLGQIVDAVRGSTVWRRVRPTWA